MRRLFIFFVVVTTVLIVAVIFSDRNRSIVSSPSQEDSPKIPEKTQISDADPQFRWTGLGVLETPLGVCGIVQPFGNKYAAREHLDDDQLMIFDTRNEARSYVWDNCQQWYRQDKAARDANEALYKPLDPAAHKKLFLDLGQPLFTKESAMACPTSQALLYASAAHARNWRYPGGLFGVDDPVRDANQDLPAMDSPVSADTWSCKMFASGISVVLQNVDPEHSGAGDAVQTNLGWVIPLDSLTN